MRNFSGVKFWAQPNFRFGLVLVKGFGLVMVLIFYDSYLVCFGLVWFMCGLLELRLKVGYSYFKVGCKLGLGGFNSVKLG